VHVLLADPDGSEAFAMVTALRGFGIGVDRASTDEAALAMALHARYAAVLVAESLPGREAWKLCRQLRDQGSRSAIVIIADGAAPDARALAAAGADDWARRPVDHAWLADRLRRCGGADGDPDRRHSKQ